MRKRALEEIERIEKDGIAQHGQSGWVPAWGKNRIQAMVENRPDWCISRQRTWGVPISLFVHKETQALHPESVRLMEEVAKRVEQSGIQAWWDLDKAELLGSDADLYDKVPDTWTSGSTQVRPTPQ